MLALVGAAAVLSQFSTVYDHVEFNSESVSTDITNARYFLGQGRFAEVYAYSASASCGTVTASITYASIKNATCSAEQCAGTAAATGYNCVQGAPRTNPSFCVPVATPVAITTVPSTTDQFYNEAFGSPTTTSPQIVKSFGNNTFGFFVTYSISRTGCGAANSVVSLSWNIRVRMPLTRVAWVDTLVPISGFTPLYVSEEAALPRHSGMIFNSETSYLPMAVTTKVEEVNKKYIDLGVSPYLELSNLNVYFATVDATSCPAVRSSNAITTTTPLAVSIKDSYDCNAFTDASLGEELLPVLMLGEDEAERQVYGSCCAQTNNQTCLTTLLPNGNRACFWAEARARCYPEFSSSTVDVRGMLTLNESITFSSTHSNRPSSTYFSEQWLLRDRFDGTVGRRWHLVIENQYTSNDCDLFVTHSFVSTTNGGICEPSTRRMCEAAAEKCSQTSTLDDNTLVYWEQGRAFESVASALEVIAEDKFKTCNCLKQKEVCYRKNGCVQTKKYDLILMNCLDQGCGNWCNSASGLHLSLASILLVVLSVIF